MKKIIVLVLSVLLTELGFAQSLENGIIYLNDSKIIDGKEITVNYNDNFIEFYDVSKIEKKMREDENFKVSNKDMSFIEFFKVDSIVYTNGEKWVSPSIINSHNYELNKVKYNLHCMHKQYYKGAGMMILGMATSTVGIVLLKTDIGGAMTILGSVFMVTGTIVIFDSHKYLKKASIGYNISPTSASLKIEF